MTSFVSAQDVVEEVLRLQLSVGGLYLELSIVNVTDASAAALSGRRALAAAGAGVLLRLILVVAAQDMPIFVRRLAPVAPLSNDPMLCRGAALACTYMRSVVPPPPSPAATVQATREPAALAMEVAVPVGTVLLIAVSAALTMLWRQRRAAADAAVGGMAPAAVPADEKRGALLVREAVSYESPAARLQRLTQALQSR